MNVPPDDKPALREWALRRRAALPVDALAAALRARIAALPAWESARDVLLYAATAAEIDLLPLARTPGKRFHLPRCAPGRRLALHPFTPDRTPLRAGPFGIREPDPDQVPETPPETIDLALVPALLLSRACQRLGYGGGYYDRLLPRLAEGAVTVGALPDALVLETLPTDPWDVPLDLVLTETRFFRRQAGEAPGPMI